MIETKMVLIVINYKASLKVISNIGKKKKQLNKFTATIEIKIAVKIETVTVVNIFKKIIIILVN